jgi:hypothetical protein
LEVRRRCLAPAPRYLQQQHGAVGENRGERPPARQPVGQARHRTSVTDSDKRLSLFSCSGAESLRCAA